MSAHNPGEGRPAPPEVDVTERGAERDGAPQTSNRRLFMQLLVYRCEGPTSSSEIVRSIGRALAQHHVPCVLYDDVNDPRSFAVMTWSEEPAHFVGAVRTVLADGAHPIRLRPEFTMIGRTYSTGYEQDLDFWLLKRPRDTVLNPAWDWAVWYPLRRTGAFSRLDPREQGSVLREHGAIGRAYGAQDLAHDIRLACHGLDASDNEFVIGLIGKDLHPLSHVVQSMRKTRQTAEFMAHMGPFFVGHVAFRNSET